MPAREAEAWEAGRALRAGAPGTGPRVAAAMGVNIATLSEHATRENWVRPNFVGAERYWKAGNVPASMSAQKVAVLAAHGRDTAADLAEFGDTFDAPAAADDGESFAKASPRERALRVAELLARQANLLLRAAETAGSALSKSQVEALAAILRLAEKFEMLAAEDAADMQKKSDDEIVELLQRVDDRIVELARGYAERMGWLPADG